MSKTNPRPNSAKALGLDLKMAGVGKAVVEIAAALSKARKRLRREIPISVFGPSEVDAIGSDAAAARSAFILMVNERACKAMTEGLGPVLGTFVEFGAEKAEAYEACKEWLLNDIWERHGMPLTF